MRWWTLPLLALVLAALVAWDYQVTRKQTSQRLQSTRIGPFLAENPFEKRPTGAIRLEYGGQEIIYVYHEGLWRCVTAYAAPAEHEPIEAILPTLVAAEGVVRTSAADDAASFGFANDEVVRLAICGPDVFTDPAGDVILAVDIGHSIASTGGSYARLAGSDDIWAIDIDFRSLLEIDAKSDAPPMLDPHIVPQAWPGVTLGPARITVETWGNDPLLISRRERTDGDSDFQWQWDIQQGGQLHNGDLLQVTSYAVFLTRAEYRGILAPRPFHELGLDSPNAIVTYETAEGLSLQLVIGGRAPGGGIVVFNTLTKVLYEVDPDLTQRMVPGIDLLLSNEQGNPWERWLRR